MLLRGEAVLNRKRSIPLGAILFFAALVALLLAVGAVKAEPRTYRDIKPFLMDTLQSPTGGLDARLEGEFADAITRHTRRPGPLRAQSRIVERYENGRCARVETRLTQPDNGVPAPAITMRVALCSDGSAYRAPAAGVMN